MELLVFSSAGAGEPAAEYRFDNPERLVLGRGPQSPVPLDGPAVSREHLSLEVRGGAVWATDVSSNGSFFNGRTLTPGAPQLVGPADEVRVGEYILRFQLASGEPSAPPPIDEPVAPPPSAEQLSLAERLLSGVTFTEWLALVVLLAAAGLIAVWWTR